MYRHSEVTHLAKAISIHDFQEQVEAKCPEETPIPSDEYSPILAKNDKARTALHYRDWLEGPKRMKCGLADFHFYL